MIFLRYVRNYDRLSFKFGEKSIDDAVVDARKTTANFWPVQNLAKFPNDWIAHKEHYGTFKNQSQRLAGRAVPVSDSLNKKIAVKDDARKALGHRLSAPVSFLARGLRSFRYQIVEFFFGHSTLVETLRNRLDDLFKRSLGKNCRFQEFQCGG